MDFYSAVRARLLLDPGVAHLVGERVTWKVRPQADPLPAIVLHLISDPRPQHLKGAQPLRETRVQVDCLAATHIAATVLAEAAIAALEPEVAFEGVTFNRSITDDVRDLGEDTETQFVHRISVDLRIWWRTT